MFIVQWMHKNPWFLHNIVQKWLNWIFRSSKDQRLQNNETFKCLRLLPFFFSWSLADPNSLTVVLQGSFTLRVSISRGKIFQLFFACFFFFFYLWVCLVISSKQLYNRKKFTYLAPCSGELPSRLLLAGTLTWSDN